MTETNGNDNGAPPVANRAVVHGALRRALRSRNRNPDSSVLLLRAAPEWREERVFTADLPDPEAPNQGTVPVPVTVRECATVLAVIDALADERDDGHFLAILTPCESSQLGESLLARAMRPEVMPVNRWDLVLDAFGARDLDDRLLTPRSQWLAESLLNAQPPGGWPRLSGPVLTLETALNCLTAARFGTDSTSRDSGVDAAALLAWTSDAPAVASFLALRETERKGLIRQLHQTAKPAVKVIFGEDEEGDGDGGLAATERITDAIPFGLAVAALYGRDDVLTARVRAEERYLAGPADHDTMVAFGEAAESLVIRWTDNGHAMEAADVCRQAERILTDLGASAAVGDSNVIEAGLNARFAELAEALDRALAAADPETLPATEAALRRVAEHGRKMGRDAEAAAAEAAVRLARWLAAPEDPPATLAEGAVRALRSWAWADRALSVVFQADSSRVPRLELVYGDLWNRVKNRRDQMDQALAARLADRAEEATERGDLLLAEMVMELLARPVAAQRYPVIVVLDGVRASRACELAETITRDRKWTEAGRREDGREAALLAGLPGQADWRASLLTGAAAPGGEDQERSGFAAFWRRRKTRLFHAVDILDERTEALRPEVRETIADTGTIVGVVTDDPGDCLQAVLDEARRASRPAILVFGHPREPSPEMIAPVITLLPGSSLRPPGWYAYDAHGHAPAWWTAQVTKPAASASPPPGPARKPATKRGARPTPEPDGNALFGYAELVNAEPAPAEAAPASLGARVMRSARMADQRRFVRRAPADASVAALIDALDRAGGRLTRPEAAEAAGASPVRLSGYLLQVVRLLNVDGYPVLQEKDDGRTVVLNPHLLRQQFLGELRDAAASDDQPSTPRRGDRRVAAGDGSAGGA